MYLTDSQIERIIDNANIEDRGTHQVNGWDKYFDSYLLDHCKITVEQKTANPRKSTRRKLLIKEIRKRAKSIRLELDISWSRYSGEDFKVVDPYGVRHLVKKYLCGQYLDFPYKSKREVA